MDAMKYMNDIVVFFWYSVLVVLAAIGVAEFIKQIILWIAGKLGKMLGHMISERLMKHDTDDDTQN